MKKVLSILASAFLVLCASSAHATNQHKPCPYNCVCDSGGKVIQNNNVVNNNTTNNTDNSVRSNSTSNASVGNVSATGGKAESSSSATGGSVKNSGNSSISNSGNFNGTVKGGAGGQGGNASIATGAVQNTVKGGDSNSTATGGNAVGISGGSFGGSGGTATASVAEGAVQNTNGQAQTQSTENSGNNVGTANVTVEGDTVVYKQRRIPVAAAAPVQIVASNDTCMGSAGGSGSTAVVSLAFSKTYVDKNCVMLKNAREMWNMGFTGAALARLCSDPANREAFAQGGIQCPDPKNKDTWFEADKTESYVTATPVASGTTPVVGTVGGKRVRE